MSKYNSFNSDKILVWEKQILSAFSQDVVYPITVNIDPTSMCNQKCYWCNAWRVMQNHQVLSREQMMFIADLLLEMDVKGVCIAGGGEPTLNKHLQEFVEKISGKIKIGMITNGINDVSEYKEHCEWIGFSVDSATKQTYLRMKGVDKFSQVLDNIRKTVKKTGKAEVSFKYLVTHENLCEIDSACLIARLAGVNDFHIRPVSYKSTENYKDRTFDGISEQLEKSIDDLKAYETETFKIRSTGYKFSRGVQEKNDFDKCLNVYAVTFCADGKAYLCPDRRGDEKMCLCNIEDFKENWLSKRHFDMLDSVIPSECPRCTYGGYNKAVASILGNTMRKELL